MTMLLSRSSWPSTQRPTAPSDPRARSRNRRSNTGWRYVWPIPSRSHYFRTAINGACRHTCVASLCGERILSPQFTVGKVKWRDISLSLLQDHPIWKALAFKGLRHYTVWLRATTCPQTRETFSSTAPLALLHAPSLYVLIFSHLELVHCHGGAQLLLPRAMARGAAVSTAGRCYAEGNSENKGQRERGGRVERETFSPNLSQPYVVHFLPAQLTRACVRAITDYSVTAVVVLYVRWSLLTCNLTYQRWLRLTFPLSPQPEGGMFSCHTKIGSGVDWSRSGSVVLSNLSRTWGYSSRRSLDAPHVSEWTPELVFSNHGESLSWLGWHVNLWFLPRPFHCDRLLFFWPRISFLKKVIPQSPSANKKSHMRSEIHNMQEPFDCVHAKTMSTSWPSYRNAGTVGRGQAPCCLPTRNSCPAICPPSTPQAIPPLTAPGDGNREVILRAMPKQKSKGMRRSYGTRCRAPWPRSSQRGFHFPSRFSAMSAPSRAIV